MFHAEQTSAGRVMPPVDGPADVRAAFFIAACAALFLLPLVWIFGENPTSLLGAGLTLAVFPGAIWFLKSYPESIPYLLIVAIYLGLFGIKIDVGQVNLRPNMLVALLGAAVIGPGLILHPKPHRGSRLLACFLLANAIYLFSTLMHPGSAFFQKGLADCVLFLVNVLQFALVLWFLSIDRKAFQRTFQMFLYISTAYAAANILLFFLGELGIPVFTQFLDFYAGETGDFVRVANLGTTEGTYLGFTVVALVGLLLVSQGREGFTWKRLTVMLGLNCFALLLTFARGPWLAVAVTVAGLVVLLMLRLPFRKLIRIISKLVFTSLLLAVAGGIVLLNSVLLRQMVLDRFEAFSALEVGTVSDRVQLWENMWEDWKLAPWLGHGAHDYAKFRDDPTQISENFLLEFLHSTGLVGFSVLCFSIGTIIVRGIRRFSSAEGLRQVPFGLPILAGFIAMCLSSLSNPGMTGGFFWVGMGLLVCAEELYRPDNGASLVPSHGQGAKAQLS